jgi:hypothetical protein
MHQHKEPRLTSGGNSREHLAQVHIYNCCRARDIVTTTCRAFARRPDFAHTCGLDPSFNKQAHYGFDPVLPKAVKAYVTASKRRPTPCILSKLCILHLVKTIQCLTALCFLHVPCRSMCTMRLRFYEEALVTPCEHLKEHHIPYQ